MKIFDGNQRRNLSGDMPVVVFKRKELGLTELLANLAVSKKIKGHLFVHSKVLGILISSQQSAV